MSYTIVEEEASGFLDGKVFQFAIYDAQYIMDRAETLEEATKICEELEDYEDRQAYLEEEVSFLVGQFAYKFDLDPTKAEEHFREYVKDWY